MEIQSPLNSDEIFSSNKPQDKQDSKIAYFYQWILIISIIITSIRLTHFLLLKKRVLVLFNLMELFLALIWKFLTKYGNINSIFHSDKFLQMIKVETEF